MTDKMWGWLRVALVVMLFVSFTSSVFTYAPQRVSASTNVTKTWTNTVQISYSPFWRIEQSASVTITYERAWPYTVVWSRINWINCGLSAIGMSLDINWCGATRKSASAWDFGYNFRKTAAAFAVQDCWVRTVLTWQRTSPNSPPYVRRDAQRSGCA